MSTCKVHNNKVTIVVWRYMLFYSAFPNCTCYWWDRNVLISIFGLVYFSNASGKWSSNLLYISQNNLKYISSEVLDYLVTLKPTHPLFFLYNISTKFLSEEGRMLEIVMFSLSVESIMKTGSLRSWEPLFILSSHPVLKKVNVTSQAFIATFYYGLVASPCD